MPGAHVFGYGSLVSAGGRPALLREHRRTWGVAMDNRVTVPGYKVYESPDGARPAVAVAFLDVEPAAGTAVNGRVLRVDAETLATLDDRERQYRRIDVRAWIDPAPGDGPVWTYAGGPEGRTRAAAGRAGTAEVLIPRAYVELVEAAFAALGAAELREYRASTEPPPFPLAHLARVDLAPG